MQFLRERLTTALAFVACLAAASVLRAQDSTVALPKIILPPVEIHGFLEVYYRSGDPLIKDGYRLRKADLKFTGAISPRLRWRVTFDAAKPLQLNTATGTSADSAAVSSVGVDQRSRILQDAALTYSFNRAFILDVGQQIVPLSLEGTIATWNVETIERTNFVVERSRAVGLGDVRDIGASANGEVSGLEYHVGMFDEMGDAGGGIDANPQKAVMARSAYHPPFFNRLQVGGSAGFEGGPPTQEKQRAATEIQYRDTKLVLRGETMAARDGLLRRFGWYGLSAYRVHPDLQLVARYDWWDRDTRAESALINAEQVQIVGGASYFIENGNAKIALNIIRQTFPHVSTIPSATFGLLAFQALF